MKHIVASLFLLLSSNFLIAADKVEPSSEIPKRREFPLNEEIKPCEDFYEHVCSKVNASFKLRDDRSFHDFAFSDSNERLLDAKKAFLANLTKKKKLSKRGQDLKTLYQACMNEDASKKEEKFYVKKILDEVNAIKKREDFEAYVAKKMGTGEFSYIGFGLEPNQDNPDIEDVYFLSSMQTLPERTYYDKDDVFGDFITLTKAFFEALGEPNSKERGESVAQLEKDTSKTHLLPVELRDRIAEPTGITREEFLKKFPNLRFDLFFSKFPEKTHMRNLSPENFESINQSMDKVPLNVLKDLYLYHALVDYMDDAYPEFFKKRFDFNAKHLGGPVVRPVRNERCTTFLMSKMKMELDAEILPEIFPNFPVERFTRLAEKMRGSIVQGLKENTWLSESTKKAAMEKMTVAKLLLVKPLKEADWNFNLPAKYYPDKPYTNIRALEANSDKKDLEDLTKPRNPNRWLMGPLTVNAYYSPPDNEFVMPIGILQYPFFDPGLPDEVNLGAVGAVIGHELGHGIDDKGAKFDSKGRMKQWFTEADLKNFDARGAKLAKQFDDLGVPGRLKLGEAIGDLVGSTFAYQAAFPKNAGTPEQKKSFFIQYGRLWCNVARPKFIEMRAKTDPHPMGKYRVNETLKNHPDFAETWGCKKGDAMFFPDDERAKIWW